MAQPGQPPDALTIMITDVVGSTALRRSRGDRYADEILALQASIVRDRVRTFGGQVRKSLGDGFLISFSTPAAAVRCALAIQRALEEHNAADPQRPVQVRIGIHAGKVSEREGDLYGQAVHAAARVAAEAVGSQILVSGVVRDEAGPELDVEFVDSGLYWLKGFAERWRLYEASWGAPRRVRRPSDEEGRFTPFVGRDVERATLRRLVDDALVGQGRLALVAGEPGVGKSRLVAEIGAEAEARGVRVLTGHCAEMSGAPPYLPYVEIIEHALSSPRSPLVLRGALGDVAPEIARIAPALRRAFPDIPPHVELPAELARRYVWNSFGEFLGRAAQEQPLLLVLEDLHWADESTVLLTEYLAPLLPEMPVLILGTYRDVEIDLYHPLAQAIGHLGRRRLVERVGLRRLALGGVRAMVEALARQEPPEELVQVIDKETDGNPFFVEEVYLHLAESGVLLDERGRVRPDLRLDEISVPESIRLVVGQRLQRLSGATREVLAAAAVLGRVFGPELVAEVANVSPQALVDGFDEAEQARLVSPIKSGGQLTFSHELIRQTLLADISTIRRARLHLRAAEVIERRHADDLPAYAADLVHHLSRAGSAADPAKLVRYLTTAGERAYDAAAFDDAVAYFERALSLLKPAKSGAGAALLERLAMALRSVGRWDDALRTMNEALDGYEALGLVEPIGRLSWAMVYQLTWSARLVEAVQVAQRALTALGDTASADKARLLSAMAWAISVGGDYDGATTTFEQARALAEQVGNERALADVLHMQTIHHMGFGEFEDGIRVGLQAAEVFEREGALWDLCSVRAFVVYEDGTMGSREQAVMLADKTMSMAERLGHLGAMFILLADRIREAAMLGDLALVETLGPRIVDLCERGGLPWLYVGHLYLGMAAHWRGDTERAETELRRAVELEPAAAFAGQSVSLLARHLAHHGRCDEVLACYESARPMLPTLDRVNSIGAWNGMLGLVEALYLCGFKEQVASMSALVERVCEVGEEWITFDGRLVRTRAALVAAADGRWSDAERHFAVALQFAERMPNRVEAADVHRLWGGILLERSRPGDAARAVELLEKALGDYRSFGMPTYAAEAERLLRRSART